MTKRLWQEGLPGEFWATTLDRLTPTTSLKDISGYYARRCATWDFSNQTAMNAELNTQDPVRNARHLFTDLIQRPDVPGWWRVPSNKAPAQGAYAMHELVPAGSGAGRVVTVNLQGLADSARGADWRASFIAVSDTGVERYTPRWNNGSSSITLAANENKLYLSVAGTPDWYANGGHNEAAEPFRSHPSRSRFHYQVQVTGATPRERNNGATTGLTQHSNGGGYRSVSVSTSVYIGPNARVTGGSVSGNARIEDYAVVSGGIVNSSAVIGGHAWVRGGTVTGDARVRDWAIVDSGTISGNARVLEHATVEGNMQDSAVAKGSAWHQNGGTLSGNAIVDGDYMGNKSLTGGITFGHLPFVGIPDNFTTSTPAGHYASYHFASAHDSRALDRFGVTDAFPIGSPAWTSTDWKRQGFLSFNGSNQYVVLDRSVADSSNPTHWAAVAIGSAQNAFVNNAANKFSSLFRLNGGTQQFASGGEISNGLSWIASASTIAVVLSDTSGNASPFNGNGSVAKLYVNGTLAGSYTLAQMGATDGHITFEGYNVFALIDNLAVSVVSTPSFAVTYNGNANTGGGVPVDTASPYAENATVTVRGNAGALVKTGYSFANWNTAANGSGTAYNPGDSFSITAPVTLFAQWSPGPDFIWNNSAGTNLWSTTAANWLGASWVNSSSNSAWFAATGGDITLAPALTAGAVNVGNTSANIPATSFSSGSLAAAALTVQGLGSNNGDYAANPTLSINSAITLGGDAAIGRANLAITGGSLTANRILSNSASADWGRLAVSGGTVTANNGVDGSVNTGATFQLELNGGTLEAPSLRIANRDLNTAGPGGNNDANLIWNGGTLKAIGPDNANFITLYGDGANGTNPTQASYVRPGGAFIDTNGRNIDIRIKLLAADGSGGLTKSGGGTLTLTTSNSYTGTTTVNASTLRLGNGTSNTNLANSADVILATGASLHLDYSGTDTIDELTVGGIAKPPGVYSAANSSFITGPGTLTVVTGPLSDYDAWKGANSVSGGPEADDDQDGLTNFAEYAFGLAPKQGTSVRAILTPLDRAAGSFTYQRRKPSLTGLTFKVWTSTNLTDWTEDSTATETATDLPGSDNQSVEVILTPTLPTPGRLFVRVGAE